MPRRYPLLVALLVLAALAGTSAIARPRPTLQAHATKLGKLLVNSRGYTLYAFSKDTRNHDACVGLPGCLYVWPALVSAKPTAGPDVKTRLIGTIKVPGVGRQVTYAGHPLYTYVGDDRPAQTGNINIFQSQGYWPAISAAGRLVK